MKDRVVLITGARGGLGSFITQRFLTEGATVIGTSRSISKEDFPHADFTALPVDFTKSTAVRDAIEAIISRFGRLDILVHVLGGFAGGQGVSETDDATWEQMRDLNLTAAFYVLRAAIPHLRKSRKGRIVAIGSLTATEPHANLGAYVTFKAALTTLIQCGSRKQRFRAYGERSPARHDGYAGKSQIQARRRFLYMGSTRGRG